MTPSPLLLQPDNFTPAQRTPWGGHRIAGGLKPSVPARAEPVGESWELSVAPEFPSALADGRNLRAVLAEDPVGWLGAEAATAGNALLVKLLDAAEHLSLQIHPDDHYGGLTGNQSGKPEAWYVVEHAPGAGVYLGFVPGVDAARVRQAVEAEADLSALMAFREVAVGDFLVIDAGTPHAVGAGVTLVEPQRVIPGRQGVTYRYWDWNRRYDEAGALSPAGSPRALHLQHALRVTDWAHATDSARLSARCSRHGPAARTAGATLLPLCGPGEDDGILSTDLQVARIGGSGELQVPAWPALRGLTVVAGSVQLPIAGGGTLRVDAGHTAVLPAGAGYSAELDSAEAILSAAP